MKQNMVEISAYHSAGFLGDYQKLVRETVIPYQYRVLNDAVEDAEPSHVIENFRSAGRVLRGEKPSGDFYGMVFQDSDAAKWLEGAAYSLMNQPDDALEQTIDELVELIAAAQDEDGYLNTHFTIDRKDRRWKNLQEGHELYCSGHMMEAAVAYDQATGKRALLDVMLRNMEHIYDRFVTQGIEGVPGHPEVELALMRMYHATGNQRCLELAKHFVDTRGVDPQFYVKESQNRDWTVWNCDPWDTDYMQCSKPVREQTDATGHAVRAVYLYTAMADLAATTGDSALYDACKRLWNSITQKRMYLTGGIGSTAIGEAFSVDYDLPSDTAYAETCASIGLMFFAARMLENEVRGEYADVMERALYNTVLAGMQLDGKRFFYVNPLESLPGISGKAPTHRHALTQRPGWYTCACCPPNVVRLLNSIGQYAYGENQDTVFCHLYAAGDVSFANGMKLHCQTEYPYDFTIRYTISGSGKFAVRIPAWSQHFTLLQNDHDACCDIVDGYAYLTVHDGDTVVLTLDAAPRYIYPSARIPALSGYVAVQRGPLVYCFEGVDNQQDVISLRVKTSAPMRVEGDRIIVQAQRQNQQETLYSDVPPSFHECDAVAVPYYTWGNRGENQMRVFMPIAD